MCQLQVGKKICFQAITRRKQSKIYIHMGNQEVYTGSSPHTISLPALHTDIHHSEHPIPMKTWTLQALLHTTVYQILHTNQEAQYICLNPQTSLDREVYLLLPQAAAHSENPPYFMTHHIRNHPAHFMTHPITRSPM
jgi:hypothetical protein